jgi:perosamine synthetase
MSLIPALIDALHSFLPEKALLHEPEMGGNEWLYVKECLDTGWVSSVGSYVDRFEAMLAEITGAKQAIATVNGTAALHACLVLAGVKPGDEVIIPTLTFVATANAVAYCGATPHFADSEEKTLGLDSAKLARHLDEIAEMRNGECVNKKTGRPIRAVVPMHTFGHPVDLDPLIETCQRFGLVMIEDAAESLGSFYKGRHTGTFGRLASLSFNGNKIVTTGGGGAILVMDAELGKRTKHLTTTAKLPHRWEFVHDEVGYNYRLPNVNAAIGCAQLERLPQFLEEKRRLAESYRQALVGVAGVSFVAEPEFAKSNYWLNVILLDQEHAKERDNLLAALNDAGLMSRPAWTPMHELSMFKDALSMDLSVACSLRDRLINLPSSPKLARS